jgi:hypothetical protein
MKPAQLMVTAGLRSQQVFASDGRSRAPPLVDEVAHPLASRVGASGCCLPYAASWVWTAWVSSSGVMVLGF